MKLTAALVEELWKAFTPSAEFAFASAHEVEISDFYMSCDSAALRILCTRPDLSYTDLLARAAATAQRSWTMNTLGVLEEWARIAARGDALPFEH